MTNLLIEGFFFSSLSVILTLLFEFVLSPQDVQRLHNRPGGKALHSAGMRATILNSLFLGAITYHVTITYCCTPGPLTLFQQTFSVIYFLVIENLCYYIAHQLMHTPQLYWMHRFHHQFNTIVLPSSANAVSVPEFVFAYMAPFAISAYFASCDKASAMVAVMFVAVSNLVIHTPALEEKAKECLPWWMVCPGDHIEHHRMLNCHFGAPIIHFDRIWGWLKEVGMKKYS